MHDLAQQKADLRKLLRKKRREQETAALSRDSAVLCDRLMTLPELQRAKTVFCYVSYGGEVQTHRLIETMFALGKTVLAPRCKEAGQMDCVPISSLAELQPGMMGIMEPLADAPCVSVEQVDFAVIPALACGEDGSRLGQGGGYYDRFLEKADCAFAAVCLEAFVLPAVPCETHDKPMKIIVTQQRVLRFEEV